MAIVYLSASNQPLNIGVGNYTNEEKRMHELKKLIEKELLNYDEIKVYTNEIGWTLKQSVSNSNSKKPTIHVALHSNAGKKDSDGTEVFFNHKDPNGKGNKLAKCINKYLSPISPGTDKGVLPDNYYYDFMYEIQYTTAPATLIENFYHSNKIEVDHFLSNMDLYAKAIVKGILEYFNIQEEKEVVKKIIELPSVEEIKKICLNNSTLWDNMINTAKENSNLGDMEIAKYFNEAVLKIFKYGMEFQKGFKDD